ncbi:hypothetical protein SEA_EASTWEST_58 [Arthrobacter phage EastWest]|uniref:Uncharacterized protein n=1 Tax=Arthrobacter phage EastWest TaxID=2894292 RepID=A0AAE8YK57_9CAUD|nr:hypothetical protein SEA_EASTWEST_58 [Arthrobacter phage EastWest]
MIIKSDTQNEITTTRRTIVVEDGPVLSEGDNYYPGTFFRVDRISVKTTTLNDDVSVRVSGKRCAPVVGGEQDNFRHELSRRDAERAGNDMTWLDELLSK